MLEMTKAINKQFFPDHKPKDGESVLGRVTCYTCHQGERTPKLTSRVKGNLIHFCALRKSEPHMKRALLVVVFGRLPVSSAVDARRPRSCCS